MIQPVPAPAPPQTPGDAYGPQPQGHLRDYLSVLWRRRWLLLAFALVFTTHAAIKAYSTQPVYQASAQLLIERVTPNVLSFKEVTEVNAGTWGDDYYQTQYKLLQSRSLARNVIEKANLLQDPEFGGPRAPEAVAALLAAQPGQSPELEGMIGGFLGRISINPVKNSRLVTVSAEALRPDLAASMANVLSELYIQQSLEHRYETSAEAGRWLGQQVEEQRKKAEQAELTLQKLREREGIVNIEERRTLLDQKLKQLGEALNQLKTTRLEKEALYRQMTGTARPEELPDVMRSAIVQALRVELGTLERQEATLLQRYLDQHPEVVKARRQKEELKAKIRDEALRVIRAAENDYKGAAAQEASIEQALEAAKAEALELSRRSVSYDTAKREVDAAKEVLNSLLSRHKQTDVAQELRSSNIRIVDKAVVPTVPIRPQRRRDIMMGLLMGLALGVGLAFFLDYLDNTIKTPEDVRERLGVPLLGVVPERKGNSRAEMVAVSGRRQGPFFEGYRLVRTSLNYSWPDQMTRVLLVTSTAPGEGKSLTSANLSLTLASLEGSVLLIDGDMRKPQLHEALGLGGRAPGLSDVLVGRATVQDVVRRVPGTNLTVLTAGTHAPSPAELLTQKAMQGVLTELRRQYRWIVVDTPPVAAVADALVLSAHCDGVVLVVGAEMIPHRAVLQTLQRIEDTGVRVLGVVLNRAQIEKHAYYYSHYYGKYYDKYHEPEEKVARIDRKAAG